MIEYVMDSDFSQNKINLVFLTGKTPLIYLQQEKGDGERAQQQLVKSKYSN